VNCRVYREKALVYDEENSPLWGIVRKAAVEAQRMTWRDFFWARFIKAGSCDLGEGVYDDGWLVLRA
jgi:hypothetical protein